MSKEGNIEQAVAYFIILRFLVRYSIFKQLFWLRPQTAPCSSWLMLPSYVFSLIWPFSGRTFNFVLITIMVPFRKKA